MKFLIDQLLIIGYQAINLLSVIKYQLSLISDISHYCHDSEQCLTSPDAEIRAEMALRNEKVNGESGEGEGDSPEDTIEEEEGDGAKGEASNEENGE